MVRLYVDGSCKNTRGGWAWIAIVNDQLEQGVGKDPGPTTNNRMELTSLLKAFEYCQLNYPRLPVVCTTDSTYLYNGVTQWLSGWKRRGWKSSKLLPTGELAPVANRDLWEQIDIAKAGLKLTMRWTKGHAENYYNELCDRLAAA